MVDTHPWRWAETAFETNFYFSPKWELKSAERTVFIHLYCALTVFFVSCF